MTTKQNLLPRVMSLAVHELRTPVTVVSGYLRMVLKEQGGPLSEKQRRMLEEAERSCNRISALVAEMSEFGKLESRELSLTQQDFDLRELIQELASGMHEGDDRGVRVEARGDQPAPVAGDRARVSAAIKALVQSAVRERGEPGVIVVQCSIGNGPPRSAVVAIGEESIVSNLENPPDAAAAAFDEWRGGLGLALPVARHVIEAHGGTLWSAEGAQSRAACALRLPLRG